ncbi:hypothetical protein ACU686_31130 [Yinghuangia aomiensis]
MCWRQSSRRRPRPPGCPRPDGAACAAASARIRTRALGEYTSRREAERVLAARERRYRDLDIRDLPAETKTKYEAAWAALQERFVRVPDRCGP